MTTFSARMSIDYTSRHVRLLLIAGRKSNKFGGELNFRGYGKMTGSVRRLHILEILE